MCDTLVAFARHAAEDVVLFGKNSDRQRNEAQAVEVIPRAEHPAGAMLACKYISLPQVRRTHAVLLSRPFWIWGAEMGANEHGVVIGNEGVRARVPPPTQNALMGMDLLRLALERAETAAQAVDVITTLLEQYGQGGDCGHVTPAFYQNAYVVADAQEGFVLETVGREWMVERVSGVRTISNRYSIDRADRISTGLEKLIDDAGGAVAGAANLADVIADPAHEHIGSARARRARSTALLNANLGQSSVADVMSVLRDHSNSAGAVVGSDGSPWSEQCVASRTICMHAGGEQEPGQTVSSLASEVYASGAVHWVTATAAPCISIFKPVLLDAPLPAHGPALTDRFEPRALWWRHEQLHRMVVTSDLERFRIDIRAERDSLETEFRRRIHAVINGGNAADRAYAVAQCWREAIEMEERWMADARIAWASSGASRAAEWARMNRLAGVPSSLDLAAAADALSVS